MMGHDRIAALLLSIILCLATMARSQADTTIPNNFTVVQWNARGQIETKIADLQNTLGFFPDIIAIQESLMSKDTPITGELTEIYNTVRHGERTKQKKTPVLETQKRGIITFIKKCHPYRTHLKHDDNFGTITITEIYINGKQRLHIANAYIKHIHGHRNIEIEKMGMRRLLEGPLRNLDDFILVGDFNCHNIMWGSTHSCAKGKVLADMALNNNMIIENRGHYTHINPHTENTCIDLTISKVKPNIGNHTWETLDPHGSDHLPILSTWGPNINYNVISMDGIRFKTEKANWDTFYELWEGVDLSEIAHEDEKKYEKNLIDKFKEIAKQSMPYREHKSDSGEENNILKKLKHERRSVPWWDPEYTEMKEKRVEALRKWESSNGCPDAWEEYKKIRNKTNNMSKHKRAAELERRLEAVNSDTSGSQVWNIIKKMDGTKGTGASNIAPLLDRHGNEAKTDKEKANALGENLQYNSSDNNYTEKFRKFKRNHSEKNPHLFRKKQTNEGSEPYNTPITLDELEKKIKQKRNSAPGADSIQYPMFKHLPPNAMKILLHFFNKIWESGDIPPDFKHAIVIPIYKTDKPINDPSSYRPIALTDHIGKILESIVTDRLNALLEERGIIKNSQSGFRGKRQTLDHISRIVHNAQYCKDRQKITGAVFLDLEKAYDLLWREGCLEELEKNGISGKMYNYILNFLQHRTFQVRVNNTLSETYKQQNGVPQGAVISPTLFNILINSIADLEKKYPHIILAQYADDLAIYIKSKYAIDKNINRNGKTKVAKTHPNYKSRLKQNNECAIRKLQYPTNDLIKQLQDRGFKVNVTKTQCILFGTTQSDKEHITVDGKRVRVSKSVTYLGITIDHRLLFQKHIANLVARGKKALQILRYLTGKKWGLRANVLKMLYLSYVLPKMTYGEELFSEHKRRGSPSSGVTARKLDVVQNMALSTITRCCKTSPSLALSVITGIPPLEIRRKEKRVNLWARFQHNPDNPARDIYYDKWEAKTIMNRGFETGIVKNTLETLSGMELTENMVAQKIKTRDFWNLPKVDIDISLSKIIDKGTTLAHQSKEITLKHIASNYNNRHHIYTDGSKEDKKVGAGYYDAQTSSKYSYRLNDNLSITSAELVAIEKALVYALGNGDGRGLLICTDSLGACMAIQRGVNDGSRPDLVMKIYDSIWDLNDAKKQTTICWIPAHVDIDGNEAADDAAKIGKDRSEVDLDVKLSYSEIKAMNRQYIKDRCFQREWDEHTGNSINIIRTFIPNVRNNVGLDNWRLNRMRVMRPKFSFTHGEAWCLKCRTQIDVHHVLLYCKRFEGERHLVDRLLLNNGKRLEIASILAPTKDTELTRAINRLLASIDGVFGI